MDAATVANYYYYDVDQKHKLLFTISVLLNKFPIAIRWLCYPSRDVEPSQQCYLILGQFIVANRVDTSVRLLYYFSHSTLQ